MYITLDGPTPVRLLPIALKVSVVPSILISTVEPAGALMFNCHALDNAAPGRVKIFSVEDVPVRVRPPKLLVTVPLAAKVDQ